MIPYTTIPFVSAFFLVLVGVLISQLLWTRSRDRYQQQIERLQQACRDLQASLQTQTDEYVRQQQQLIAACDERDEFRNRLGCVQTLLLQREEELSQMGHQLLRLRSQASSAQHGPTNTDQAHGPSVGERSDAPAGSCEGADNAPDWELRLREAESRADEWEQRYQEEAARWAESAEQLRELTELRAECERQRTAQELLEQQLTVLRHARQQVEGELQQVRQREHQIQQHRLSLETQVRELRDEQRELKQELRQAVSDRDEFHCQWRAGQQEAEQQIRAMQSQLSETLSSETSLREVVDELREELDSRVDRMELLQEEKESALASATMERKRRALAEQSLLAVRETLQQLRKDNEALSASHSETVRRLDPGGCSIQPRDDLQQIQGIADVLEAKLNELGVSTYRQIMEWDAEAISEYSHKLGLDDRIVRDDWISQARELHQRFHRAA